MYQEMHEQDVMPIGFGRSLVWAAAVTAVASASASIASLSPLHRPSFLPACLFGAAIFYPVVTHDASRHRARGALLAALLLVPVLDSVQRPSIAMFGVAIVIGLLRSWFCWAQGKRLDWQRELSCLAASLALGGYLIGSNALGVAFGVWGFCLGQVVASLFGDPGDR